MKSDYLYRIYKDNKVVLENATYRQAIELIGKHRGFKLSCYAKNGELIDGYRVELYWTSPCLTEKEIEAIQHKSQRLEKFNKLWHSLKVGQTIAIRESGYDPQSDTEQKWMSYRIVQIVGNTHIALQRTTNPRRTDYTKHAMWEFYLRGGIK